MGRRREGSAGTSRRRRIGLIGGAAAAVVAVLVVVGLVVLRGSDDEPPTTEAPPTAGPAPTTAPETRAPPTSVLPWPSGVNANPPRDFRQWEAWVGRPADVAVVFTSRTDWGTLTRDDWPVKDFRPENYSGLLSVAQPLFPPDGNEAACARGEYDHHWAAFGQTLVRNGRPDAIVRLGWEFNGRWMYWHPRDTETWKQCFRRAATAIRSTSPQVRIDWNMAAYQDRLPNGGDVWDAYPGDDVVDIVSIDVYDVYPPSRDQETFNRQCWRPSGPCTVTGFARQHGKPFAVPEWGLDRRNGGGGDNPFFIEKMYAFFEGNKDILLYEAYYHTSEPDNVQSSLYAPTLNPQSAQRYLELFSRPPSARPATTPPQTG